MTASTGFADRMNRRHRMKAYLGIRRQLEALSDDDLADMGLKRYQLGHVARTKFFG